jgi:ribose transport system ATP-binding protein
MMLADSAEVVLQMHGIEKRFGALPALSGVSFELRRGEVHALIGENGAGKSTLMKVLSGAHAADAGGMVLLGRPYAPRSPLEARERGVAMIYQELTLAPHLSVAQNIVLGREPERLGWVDRQLQARRVTEALSWLDQPELEPGRLVATLAPGARQLVEVARALVGDARVVVMDEPTSSLSRGDTERLFEIIARLRTRGVSVIYISHFLEEVRRVAQRYTVLRDGRSVETASIERGPESVAAFAAHVIEIMAGRELADVYPRVPHTPGDVVLELDGLSGVRLPRDARLVLRRGEILGIAGLVGAGRTELLRALFGLDAVTTGRVRVGGNVGQWDLGKKPWQRLAQGLGLLSENRKEEGLALGLSIADNLTLSRPLARFGVIARGAQAAATRRLGDQLGLRYRSGDQPVAQLSGGNQQKVAIARLLHHDVDVLLLDEPTRGIDVGSKAEIYRLMGQLAAAGKAIIFVSSYLPELLGVCDRIAVMSRGRLGEPRARHAWSEASLLDAATAGGHG